MSYDQGNVCIVVTIGTFQTVNTPKKGLTKTAGQLTSCIPAVTMSLLELLIAGKEIIELLY